MVAAITVAIIVTSERFAIERASVRASERACERASERASVRESERAVESASERACERARKRACERASVRASQRASERASVRARERASLRARRGGVCRQTFTPRKRLPGKRLRGVNVCWFGYTNTGPEGSRAQRSDIRTRDQKARERNGRTYEHGTRRPESATARRSADATARDQEVLAALQRDRWKIGKSSPRFKRICFIATRHNPAGMKRLDGKSYLRRHNN